jgi:hypothetical protein
VYEPCTPRAEEGHGACEADSWILAGLSSTSTMSVGARLWAYHDTYGWQPGRLGAVGEGELALIEYDCGTHQERVILDAENATISFSQREPPHPPSSVAVGRSAMSMTELRNMFLRGIIRPPAALISHETGLPRLCMGVDFEVRWEGGAEREGGLALYALRDLPCNAVVSVFHGAVRRVSDYARIRTYAGPEKPDWNKGQHAVVVPGSSEPQLCVDGWEGRLSIAAAVASGDLQRISALAQRGVASACNTVQYGPHNCNYRWTASGQLLLLTRWAPGGYVAAVKAGDELLAVAPLTVS